MHCDPVHSANQDFAERVPGAVVAASNADVVRQANVVFLAVKPQNMAAVFAEIGGALGSEKLVVSIAAGVTIARLCEGLKTMRVVRVMPNTPALAGEALGLLRSAPGRQPPMASLSASCSARWGRHFKSMKNFSMR